ncbi:hypothetical protein [Acaryochloris marina]|uniref:hypothetical protein n=1 Tax=Acaryochloris marina TaxID=155978 RepID=UPI001BAE6427|nr:hypothetical protein [Acaryochloris marina]QUY40677.1 hypothetical protein I1H34_15260 [Acaryochloris marina S15]
MRPALLEAITILQSHGGRLTAPELQAEMRIGLSTAYTYLNQLFSEDFVERVKIETAMGTSKQFLYIMKSANCEGLDLPKNQKKTPNVLQNGCPDSEAHSEDPIEEVLEILSSLSKKVRTLERRLAALEQEKHKSYPLLSALKQDIEMSDV